MVELDNSNCSGAVAKIALFKIKEFDSIFSEYGYVEESINTVSTDIMTEPIL